MTFSELFTVRTGGNGPFARGILPPSRKARSLRSVIMQTPLPERLVIPLTQYGGNEATPVVEIGQRVLKGQALTRIDLGVASPVHAPTSGHIEAIGLFPVAAPLPTTRQCVVLRSDGLEQWLALSALPDWQSASRHQLLEIIHTSGVTGQGGAGFPLAAKISALRGREPEWLIINAAECRPYISCDQALVRAHATELIAGIAMLQYISGAHRVVIAIGRDMHDAINALQLTLPPSGPMLHKLPPHYPSGHEQILFHRITGRRLPEGSHPTDHGALVVNVATVHAAFRAITLGRPLISRLITLCGDALATPKNFEVLIGTPVDFLLQLCGADYPRLSRLICGDPLTGYTLTDTGVPVDKNTNCLIAGSEAEFPGLPAAQPCIRCGRCADACPVSLEPRLLFQQIQSQALQNAADLGLADCIDCGACAWVCPSHIPLLQYFRHASSELEILAQRLGQRRRWQQRYENRQRRMARAALEKDGRRKTRAGQGVTVSEPEFDRQRAKEEIAAAVSRSKAKRRQLIASDVPGTPSSSMDGES